MRAFNIFTRRALGLDYRVWLAMLVTCGSSLALLGYTHTNHKNTLPCAPGEFIVNGKPIKAEEMAICYVNQLTLFKIEADSVVKVSWDFGDGTATVEGYITTHIFKKEGRFNVKATVNNRCVFEQEVTVGKALLSSDGEAIAVDIFQKPMLPKAGAIVEFYAVSSIARIDSYKWELLNTGDVQQSEVATFALNAPGRYTVQLVINNDPATRASKVIEVVADAPLMPDTFNSGVANPGVVAPIGPPPVLMNPGLSNAGGTSGEAKNGANRPDTGVSKPVTHQPKTDVAPETFKALLQEVINENKEIEELYEFLDYRGSTKVKVNEETALISLKDFCKNMRNEKKNRKKIEALRFKKDDKNSIQTIEVKVPQKKGFWDLVNPFD